MEQNNIDIDKNEKEYVDALLRIIQNELPIISQHNKHLHMNISSAIELVLDQSYNHHNSGGCNNDNIKISEETKKEVDLIVEEILNKKD